MSRNWNSERLPELIRRGRNGDLWVAIERAISMPAANCRSAWLYHGSDADFVARDKATAVSRQIALARKEVEAQPSGVSGKCFHDSPRAVADLGSLGNIGQPDETRRSGIGCAALMVCS